MMYQRVAWVGRRGKTRGDTKARGGVARRPAMRAWDVKPVFSKSVERGRGKINKNSTDKDYLASAAPIPEVGRSSA